MPLDYIKVVDIDSRKMKKSWLYLFHHFLRTTDFEGYLYIHQKGTGWQSINYQNALRACRAYHKPKLLPLSQARWWLDVRKGWRKNGVVYNLNKHINYTKNT